MGKRGPMQLSRGGKRQLKRLAISLYPNESGRIDLTNKPLGCLKCSEEHRNTEIDLPKKTEKANAFSSVSGEGGLTSCSSPTLPPSFQVFSVNFVVNPKHRHVFPERRNCKKHIAV